MYVVKDMHKLLGVDPYGFVSGLTTHGPGIQIGVRKQFGSVGFRGRVVCSAKGVPSLSGPAIINTKIFTLRCRTVVPTKL